MHGLFEYSKEPQGPTEWGTLQKGWVSHGSHSPIKGDVGAKSIFSPRAEKKNTKLLASYNKQKRLSPVWLEKYLESRAEFEGVGNVCTQISLGEVAAVMEWGQLFWRNVFFRGRVERHKLDAAGLDLAAAPSLQFNRPRGMRLTYIQMELWWQQASTKKAEASRTHTVQYTKGMEKSSAAES